MPPKKPTKAEQDLDAAIEAARWKDKIERGIDDMGKRLTHIEQSIQGMQIADLSSRLTSAEAKIKKLEENKESVIKVVLYTVGVAILATVVGVNVK